MSEKNVIKLNYCIIKKNVPSELLVFFRKRKSLVTKMSFTRFVHRTIHRPAGALTLRLAFHFFNVFINRSKYIFGSKWFLWRSQP